MSLSPANAGVIDVRQLLQHRAGVTNYGSLKAYREAVARNGSILSPGSLQVRLERHELGGAIPGRPWTLCGYGLGLMFGRMGEAGAAIGHSGGGPHSVNAVYHFRDLASPVTVATFTDGADEGLAEWEALSIARRLGA